MDVTIRIRWSEKHRHVPKKIASTSCSTSNALKVITLPFLNGFIGMIEPHAEAPFDRPHPSPFEAANLAKIDMLRRLFFFAPTRLCQQQYKNVKPTVSLLR